VRVVELSSAIARRRMTRRFSPRTLEPEVLDQLLAAALRAPSAGFAQGVELLVLSGAASRQRFWELNSTATWREGDPQAPGLLAAPVIVLPVADPTAYLERYAAPDKADSGLAGLEPAAWPVAYWLVDAAFVVMSLLLAATDADLAALFFRLRATPAALLAAFGVPSSGQLIGAVALGHPAPAPAGSRPAPRRRPARRPADDLVHRDGW
jgi:nitroreductase